MFPGVAKLGNMFRTQNLCPGSKNVFLLPAKTFFVFRAAKFVSATHVSRAAKLGNICIRNNVSQFSQAFILLPEKFLPFDWVRAEVFQLNSKYLHVKITITVVTQNHQIISSHELRKNGGEI